MKMGISTKKTFMILGLVMSFFGCFLARAQESSPQLIESIQYLREYMSRFGTTVAGLEIMRSKDETIDWQIIKSEVAELNKALHAMKKSDKTKKYSPFLNELSIRLQEVTQKAKKKDPSFYDSFDKMTESCFACHAAHRPADFLKPSKSNYSHQ